MNGFLVILPRTAASSGTFPGDDIVKTSPACGHGKLFTAVAWLDTRVAPDRARRRQTDVCTRQLRRYNWCRGARPAAARHVGWLAGRVCAGGTRAVSLLSGVNRGQGARGHLQVQESSSQVPGQQVAAGGVQCRSAGEVRAARTGASAGFAVLCCGWRWRRWRMW